MKITPRSTNFASVSWSSSLKSLITTQCRNWGYQYRIKASKNRLSVSDGTTSEAKIRPQGGLENTVESGPEGCGSSGSLLEMETDFQVVLS